MTKTATKVSEAKEVTIPTGLKELVAMAKDLGIKYTFQKKPELTELIKAKLAEKGQTGVVEEEVKEDAKKPAAKKAKTEEVKMPEPDGESEEEESEEEETDEDKEEAKAPAKKVDTKAKAKVEDKPKAAVKKEAVKEEKKADVKKSEPVKEDKPVSKGKKTTTVDDLPELLAREDVKEILNTEKYTKSDKVRKLYHKLALAVGQISRILDIHYSFAYCVIDAFRKGNPSVDEDRAKIIAARKKSGGK